MSEGVSWSNLYEFKENLKSTSNNDIFRDRVENAYTLGKLQWLINRCPETFIENEIASSVTMNLMADYNKIIPSLPKDFELKVADKFIHVDNANQLDLYYNGTMMRRGQKRDSVRIACMSFYFLDSNYGKELVFENIQGDIRTGSSGRFEENKQDKKELNRVFGKLKTFYDTDWRQGILQQAYTYGKSHGMGVSAKLPGLFFLFRSSMREYPMYALNYLSTYLKMGIPLENISFKNNLPDDVRIMMDKTFDILRTKSTIEKISLVDKAASMYRKEYDLNLERLLYGSNGQLYGHFDGICSSAFQRIFLEVFN